MYKVNVSKDNYQDKNYAYPLKVKVIFVKKFDFLVNMCVSSHLVQCC